MEQKEAILYMGVLNDDIITATADGVKITYYFYATAWNNSEHVRKFKSITAALEWYAQELQDRAISQGYEWRDEWRDDSPEYARENSTDADALQEWRDVVESVLYN